MTVDWDTKENAKFYEVEQKELLKDEYPNLLAIPTIHQVQNQKLSVIPYVLINLSYDRIHLPKGELLRHLQPIQCKVQKEKITKTHEVNDLNVSDLEEMSKDTEQKFMTSPADVETHRKVQLQDAEVTDEYRERFKQLCEEYSDIFSQSSIDLGRTPLITMEIETGDSPPICQKPYNLPLKHAEWVQREINTLEEAGVITRSVSPWASPIVVVPKKSEPGEPPRRRLCVDYSYKQITTNSAEGRFQS